MKRLSVLDRISKTLHLHMFNIPIEKALLCMMSDGNMSMFFTPSRINHIRSNTRMFDMNTYEILGDAVYEVILMKYIWDRKIDLDLYLLGRCKSNITMSRTVEVSPLYRYVKMTQRRTTCKSVADVFESTIGMIYDHIISTCTGSEDITHLIYTWMDNVYNIDKVIDDMVRKRVTPSGSIIYIGEKVDILHYYRLSIQKLACTYHIFNRHRYSHRCSTTIHHLYDRYRDVIYLPIRSSLDYTIGSCDPLKYILYIQNDITSMMS